MSDDDRGEDFDPNDDQYADEDAIGLAEGALPDDDAATAVEFALVGLGVGL